MDVRVAYLCLVLSVFVYGASSEYSAYATVPVLMWSDKQVFSAPKIQHVDTVKTKDVEYALYSLFSTPEQGAALTGSFNQNMGPTELVVLFVEPELTTDQVSHIAYGGLSQLKNAFETASSSLTLPYATIDEVSLLDEALSVLLDTPNPANIFISRMPGSKLFSHITNNNNNINTVEIDQLFSTLKSSNAFSNGVTDLVVVCFAKESLASHDETIGKLSHDIKVATSGNYVAVYTGNRPTSAHMTWTFELHSSSEFYHNTRFAMLDATNNTNCTSPNCTCTVNCTYSHTYNYFPGPLIEVYLIAAILIAMLFTGGCAIFSLQTPDRWEIPKTKGKDL